MKQLMRLMSYLGPYKKSMAAAVALLIIETCFELIIPVIMADIIDIGVEQRNVHVIMVKGVQMGICAVLALVTGLLYARFAAQACVWPRSEDKRGAV